MEQLQYNSKRPRLPLNREHVGILIIVAAFFLFPYLIRKVDYTAAAIDPGILSAVLLSILTVLIFQAMTWWIIRVIWTVFATYSIHHFENNFKSLESWQKVCIYLAFYLLLLYSFVAVLVAFI